MPLREVFLAIGGFEENYRRPMIEDIELGYRLKKAGHRIRLFKDLQVKHLKRWEILSLLKVDFKYRALPWTDLILKEGNFINDLNTTLSSRLSVICTFLLLASLLGAFWIPWLLICLLASDTFRGLQKILFSAFLKALLLPASFRIPLFQRKFG